MRVDFSEWYTDQTGLLARKYTYKVSGSGTVAEIEVHFDIEAGLLINTFLSFIVNGAELPQSGQVKVSIWIEKNKSSKVTFPMMVLGGRIIGMASKEDVQNCLRLYLQGKDLMMEVFATDGEKLLMLPLPNRDDKFEEAYKVAYEKVRDAEQKSAGGTTGLMSQLMRSLGWGK